MTLRGGAIVGAARRPPLMRQAESVLPVCTFRVSRCVKRTKEQVGLRTAPDWFVE